MSGETYYFEKLIELLSKEALVERDYLMGRSKILKINNHRLLVKFSQNRAGKLFFGLDKSFSQRFNKKTDYILFVCGNEKKVLVVPSNYIYGIYHDVAPVLRDNNWKINMFEQRVTYSIKPTGKAKVNLTEYLNNYKKIFGKILENGNNFLNQKLDTNNVLETIKKNDPLLTIYAESKPRLKAALKYLASI